jgi:hypothetical protein
MHTTTPTLQRGITASYSVYKQCWHHTEDSLRIGSTKGIQSIYVIYRYDDYLEHVIYIILGHLIAASFTLFTKSKQIASADS